MSSSALVQAACGALLIHAQAGDRAAFSDLVKRHHGRVLATAYRLLQRRDDALDATQEVFLRMYRYLGSFRAGEDFGGWLYRIVVNVCNDLRRRRAATLPLDDARIQDELSRSPEAQLAAADEGRRLQAALSILSERERTALVLRDIEGLQTEQVARILGSSATTIRSQICLARAKLRAARATWTEVSP